MRKAPRPTATLLVACLALASSVAACWSRAGAGTPGGATEAVGRPHRIRLPDVTLHTLEVGSTRGPVRLVVHGGPGLDHTYLRPWLDRLAGARARVVYVDLRGHGRSDPPADAHGYTISAASSDLATLIPQLGTGPAVDVIGHDFGGAVALDLAARHPERVRRLVLIDPLRDAGQIRAIPAASREVLGETGWRRILDLSTPQGTLRDPRTVTELFRRLGGMWWYRPPADAVIQRMGRDLIYRGEADAGFLIDAAGWDARARAAEVRAPALVVSGAADRTFPPADSRALAEALPHGRYAEIPAAGHLPFIEQPDRLAATVEGFLAGTSAAE